MQLVLVLIGTWLELGLRGFRTEGLRPGLDNKRPPRYVQLFSLPRYNFLGVMSTIGGSLGLYLGFSLLDSYRVIGAFVQVLANWKDKMK